MRIVSRVMFVPALVLLLFAASCEWKEKGKTEPTAKTEPPAITAPAAKDAPKEAPAVQPLQSDKDKRSYAIGMEMGANMRQQKLDLDVDLAVRGLRDAFTGAATQLSEEQKREVLTSLQRELMEKRSEDMRKAAEENLQKSQAFLDENKTKAGVQTTPSGLQYQVVQPGSGPKPGPQDTVTVHYVGTLLDGTEFDSSVKRGQPATFPVSGVIPGWTEILQIMEPGAKYKVWIPPTLAYGARGAGPIAPNSLLIFEIELISVQGKEPAAGAPEQPAGQEQPKQ